MGWVVQFGLGPDQSTISRAELWAVVWIIVVMAKQFPTTRFHIYTNSQYVYDAVLDIEYGTLVRAGQTRSHADLLNRIIAAWHPNKFYIHKVKSHRTLEEATNYQELLKIQGNTIIEPIKQLHADYRMVRNSLL